MSEFAGKFKLVSSDKFDEYMSALKVGFVMRKLGNSLTPVVEVSNNGDEWAIKTSTTFKTSEIKFKLGEEFEEERIDGVKVTSVVTRDGNKLVHVMKGDPESTIIREFNGNEMKATMAVGDVVCTRLYKSE